MNANQYTVCISNFQRPEHLRRCLESVKSLPNVVVACYGAGPEHRKIIEEVRPGTRCYVTENDHGENRLLMQAVVMAETEWVVILHDDDQLVPEFQSVMDGVEPGDAGFIGWDGVAEWYGKKPPKSVHPWGKIENGFFDTASLVDSVTKPNGGMVKSPVTMMLRRDLSLAVLSWCEDGLKDFHTRPKMMIGNEIALLFGHIKEYPMWYHISTPLVKFGHWEGSETCLWLAGKSPELINLYDGVRKKFGAEQFLFRRDKIVPIFVHVHTTGGDNPRKPLATVTWQNEWKTLENDWLIVPLRLKSEDMERTSAVVGDERKLPFVKDLIRRATKFTYNCKDVVLLTNDDVCITEGGLSKMVEATLEKGSTYAHRRTFRDTELKPLGLERLSRILTPDEVATGRRHSGTDAVLVTKKWWELIGEHSFADFIIACEAWDTLFIMVSRMSGAGWGWRNTTYHEYHGGWWEDMSRRFSNKGQIHNRNVAKEMLLAYGVYNGEFDHDVRRDPAHPKNPPGVDSDPVTPPVPYIGGRNSEFTPVKIRVEQKVELPISRPVKSAAKPLPHKMLDRAIVYPWKATKATWEELRYSIRSVENYFADKTCPIIILGTEAPPFLKTPPGRFVFHDEWTYSDCLKRGTQMARKILWMNDDILMVKPCGWDDFTTARHVGTIPKDVAASWSNEPNQWKRGLGKAAILLYEAGTSPVRNFSTHIPYIYEADKAMEIFQTYGIWEKVPMETLYFNHHATPSEPIGGFKTRTLPAGDATVLNFSDSKLTEELKAAIEAMLPEPTRYEFVPHVQKRRDLALLPA